MSKNKSLYLIIPLLLTALCLLFKAPSPAEAAVVDGNTIAKGVNLGGVNLGGMTLEQATAAVEKHCQELSASEFKVNVYSTEENGSETLVGTYSVPLSEFGFSWSAEEALKKATTFGQKGRLIELYKNLQDLQYDQVNLPLECSVKPEAIRFFVENTLAAEINREPVNASVVLNGRKVVVTEDGKYGVSLNTTATAETIYKCFANGVPAELSCRATATVEKPHYMAADFVNVTSMLGEFTTYVNTASTHTDRNRNIARQMELMNGDIVMPGEEYSVCEHIIPVTLENGYHYAGAYENGRTILQVGGGICQGSTTLYNAVLRAELEVVRRHNHSMLIDYVEPSFDAAISEVNFAKDFVFRNNTDAPIYIQTYFSGDQVVARLYGHETRPSNRKVEYKSTVLVMNEYSPKYVLVDSQNPGVPKEDGHYLPETRSTLTKIVKVGGVVQSEEVLNQDYYRQCDYKITIGTNTFPLMIQKDDRGIDRLYTTSGQMLLVTYNGVPYYDGSSGYLLAKDYKCNKYGIAELDSNRKPIRITPVVVPTTPAPTTEEPTTEPTTEAPTEPPVTEPPVTEPPVTEPPATEPPATEPPATEPPATEPPATEPPATEPPATEPPATEPPAETEPALPDIPANSTVAQAVEILTAAGLGNKWWLKDENGDQPPKEGWQYTTVNMNESIVISVTKAPQGDSIIIQAKIKYLE